MTFTEIKNRVYFLTKTNSTSFPVADLTRAANNALEHVSALILRCDSRWQFDDTNQTDLPIATTALVASQQDYSLATTHLTIDRVEVKDSAGNWHRLTPIDQQLLKGDRTTALAEYRETTGLPEEYDLIGNSVFLYPAPNYSQAASLKLYFTRPPSAFDTADTTKTPGFNSLFHDLIPLWVSYDYCIANGLPKASGLLAEIERKEADLYEFYGTRDRDTRNRFTMSTDSNK